MRRVPSNSSLGVLVLAALAALPLAGCGGSSGEPARSSPPPSPLTEAPASPSAKVTEVTLETVGLDPLALDRSAKPCDDFYRFACGGWIDKIPIPGDEAMWARSFSEIRKKNELELRRLLEEASSGKAKDEASTKLGAFYGACMDEASVDAAGAKPISPWLKKAGSVRDAKSLAAFVTELHAAGLMPLFEVGIAQDFKDATKWNANLDQGGLGLPDRDYYVKDDDKTKKIRADYLAHVERMLSLAGVPEKAAKAAAADVLALETEIAKVSKTRVERRNPKGLYNKIDRAGLAKVAPSFAWDPYWKGLGFPDVLDVNVTSVPFFEGVERLLKTAKPSAWQNYLKWHVVLGSADHLSKPFVDERFRFAQALMGLKEQKPRWRRCVAMTDGALGELLAQGFVRTNFPGGSKRAAEEMVAAISRAFERDVRALDWMDEKTKARALAKREAMAYLIGYPEKWKTYEFEVDPKAHAKNVFAASAFEMKRDLAKVGKEVDRNEWQMTPPTVNAYYDPQRNHMVFPAGILQPPFYSVKSATPVNLGAIGMVVGHELTHGFDDEGSQFDAQGNLENWWSPEVAARFKEKTACVRDQYASFEPLPGQKINGELTLGENIADLAGLKLAFEAYRDLRKGAAEVLVAGGFSEDQQFFLAYAQGWCAKMSEELARLRLATDPHSPPKYRVNGVVANLPEFAEAFQCPAGAPMRPAKTCSVW